MGTKNSSSRRVPRRPLFFHLKGCTWNGEQFSLGANNRVEKAGKRNRGGREKGIFESIPARVFGGYNNTRGGGGGACFKYLCVIKWTSERERERRIFNLCDSQGKGKRSIEPPGEVLFVEILYEG